MPKIALVWDFDGTLTPDDSTTKTVEVLQKNQTGNEFWNYIKSLRGDTKKSEAEWQHILASDAPIWTYSLARIAARKKVPLNKEFFKQFILPDIKLYPGVVEFLTALKDLSGKKEYKKLDIQIHHFIVSAGLKDLIEQVFPAGLITHTFGCRYEVVINKDHPDEPESIPVFCMDETMKTRSLFEISKGSFEDEKKPVNAKIEDKHLWAPFSNMIYIGDGPTDIPSLALTRTKGGLGIVVYNPTAPNEKVNGKLKEMRSRMDFVSQANFALNGELFNYMKNRCEQIRQKYEADTHLKT